MREALADAKIEDDELQLARGRQAGGPDVGRGATPQLHRTARPPVLLLAVCKEAGG